MPRSHAATQPRSHAATRLVATLLMVGGVWGGSACSGDSDERGGAPGTAAIDHALSKCTGTLYERTLALPYSGRVATIRTCVKPPPLQPEVDWLVAGKVVDPVSEWRKNYQAFAQDHYKLDPALASAASGEVDVDVWFAVDERDLPTKEARVSDPSAGLAVEATLDARITSTASALRTLLAARIPGAVFAPPLPRPIPRLTLRVPAADLKLLGESDAVVRVVPAADHEEEVLQSENYIQLGLFDTLAALSWNGAGVKVAMLEGGQPDSYANLSGVPPGGSCSGSYLCACPSSNPGGHMRATMGIVRNSVTMWGGAASAVTTLPAGWSGGVGCSMSGSAIWALNNGASIITRTGCGSPGSPQTGSDRYLDYLAMSYPLSYNRGRNGQRRARHHAKLHEPAQRPGGRRRERQRLCATRKCNHVLVQPDS